MKVKKWVVVVGVREIEVEDNDDPIQTTLSKPGEDEFFASYPLDTKQQAIKFSNGVCIDGDLFSSEDIEFIAKKA